MIEMKDIASVTLLDKKRAEKGMLKPSRDEAQHMTDELFERFSQLFLYSDTLYEDQDEFESVKNLWASTFFEEGITYYMLRIGLRATKLENSGFMPTIGQFIARCLQGDPSFPRPHDITQEIIKNAHPSIREPKWSHPIAMRTCQIIGSHNASGMSSEQLHKAVDRAYAQATREHVQKERNQIYELNKL